VPGIGMQPVFEPFIKMYERNLQKKNYTFFPQNPDIVLLKQVQITSVKENDPQNFSCPE
jgi:hypothetical protein